jgi:hypothetical protein
MDKIQHKLAMEFFRSEIKKLVKRLVTNKSALRHNQQSLSKGQPQVANYDTTGERYWYCAEGAIRNDKTRITSLHIIYGELRGKPHLTEEKKKEYATACEAIRKRLDEYIKEKQSIETKEVASVGGV